MVTQVPERKRLTSQRRTRRLRQQRVLHANGYAANDNGVLHSTADERKHKRELLLSDLGWSKEQILESYYRFKRYSHILDAPGMEEYDEV